MTTRLLLLAASMLAWGLGCKAGPTLFPDDARAPPSPVRVAFKPPEGTPIVERTVTTRTESAGGNRSEQAVHTTLTSTFERAPNGWILTQRASDVRLERDGASMESPLLRLVAALAVQVQLANDGAFVALANPEAVEEAVRAAFPEPLEAAAVMRYFTSDAVARQTRQEWDSKYAELLGRDVLPGHAWYYAETLTATGGAEKRYVVERKVAEIRASDRGREVVVALSCPHEVETAANSVALRRFLEAVEEVTLDGAVKCSGEQVIGLEPFVPLSFRFEVTGSVALASGGTVDVRLTRAVSAAPMSASPPRAEEVP